MEEGEREGEEESEEEGEGKERGGRYGSTLLTFWSIHSAIQGSRLTTDPHQRTWTNWIATWTESITFDLRLLYVVNLLSNILL